MAGTDGMDNDLELVRRGFDPTQVQQLVGQLSTELKSMAAENERLRNKVAELEAAPRPVAGTPNDVFEHWSKETNDLLDAARASIASVTEKATADAAAALAAGETAATTIRQRATLDGEGIVAAARTEAAAIVAGAETEKARLEADAAAEVARRETQVAALETKLADLRGQRSTMSQQLNTAKSHLLQLMSLVDEPEAAPTNGVVDLGAPTANEQL